MPDSHGHQYLKVQSDLYCNFCKGTLVLLTEYVQPCITVSVIILCTPERGHSVVDTHLFSMFCIKYLLNYYNLKLCFGTFLAECTWPTTSQLALQFWQMYSIDGHKMFLICHYSLNRPVYINKHVSHRERWLHSSDQHHCFHRRSYNQPSVYVHIRWLTGNS